MFCIALRPAPLKLRPDPARPSTGSTPSPQHLRRPQTHPTPATGGPRVSRGLVITRVRASTLNAYAAHGRSTNVSFLNLSEEALQARISAARAASLSLHGRANSILNAARAEGREPTEVERARVDALLRACGLDFSPQVHNLGVPLVVRPPPSAGRKVWRSLGSGSCSTWRGLIGDPGLKSIMPTRGTFWPCWAAAPVGASAQTSARTALARAFRI